jgi:uncharacterized protein YndB with AHSA1/START domain
MSKSIQHTVYYPHSPEAVWEYLTQPELIAQWLMPNDFKPVAGHAFQFRHGPMPDYNLDGIVYCEVLEIVPFQKLSYSWKAGPGNGKIIFDSVVTFTLAEKDNGTELTLRHDGFTNELASLFTIMDAGWSKNIRKINELKQS